MRSLLFFSVVAFVIFYIWLFGDMYKVKILLDNNYGEYESVHREENKILFRKFNCVYEIEIRRYKIIKEQK